MPYSYSWLASGAYNDVYIREDKKRVFKIQKKAGYFTDAYDNPTRSVLLWNTINAYLGLSPAEAGRLEKVGDGWFCPYIEGRSSTDEEIRDALVEIFHVSGRIILDPQHNNFLTMSDGRAVCIDMGLALGGLGVSSSGRVRRPSATSKVLAHHFDTYLKALDEAAATFPLTVAMVKALLLINEIDPRIRDVRLLKDNPSLVQSWVCSEDPAKVGTEIITFFSMPESPLIRDDSSPSAAGAGAAGSPALSEPSTLSDDSDSDRDGVVPMVGVVPRTIPAPKAIPPRAIVKPSGVPAALPLRSVSSGGSLGSLGVFALGNASSDEHQGGSVEKNSPPSF